VTRGVSTQVESRILDDAARQEADGSFVKLQCGFTHYQDSGAGPARPLVLVHGFSVPYFIWNPTFHNLASAGLRLIRYDLYGRGYSDRPKVRYDLSLFIDQLRQLLDALEIQQADLAGLSMGGPIASAFTVAFPERVRRLVLIDPSGVKPLRLGLLYRLVVLPGVSDILFHIAGTDFMLNSVASDFFDPRLVQEFRERYGVQMAFQGFNRAILSTVRNKMLGSFLATYEKLGELGTPVLVIWGEHDKTVPFEHSRVLRQLIPAAEFLTVPDCGHIPHYERPELVNPGLIQFLS
jgi:pimeloyl-ACP methyl ester carboxylesterase